MVIKGDIQSEGKLLTKVISLLASFEWEVVSVFSFFPWGLKIDAADSEDSLRFDCPYMNLHGFEVLN